MLFTWQNNLLLPYHHHIVTFHCCGVHDVFGVGKHHNHFCILYCVIVSLFLVETWFDPGWGTLGHSGIKPTVA